MLNLGNQQITSGWFTGLLEGEGSFRRVYNSTRVSISNSNLDLIEACESFLKVNYIYSSRYTYQREGKKKEYLLDINTNRGSVFNYPKILYGKIDPHLQCRRKEYQHALGISETICNLSVDLDWLIGVFEAEGSFSLIMNNRNIVAFKIEISNTNYTILDKVILIFKYFGCSWNIADKIREVHWKPTKAIEIYGMKRCRLFLKLTKDKWVAKRNKQRTSLMLEFIENRLPKNQKEPYSIRELEIVELMKELNRK